MARPKGSKTKNPNAYAGRTEKVKGKYGDDIFRRWGKLGGNPMLLKGGGRRHMSLGFDVLFRDDLENLVSEHCGTTSEEVFLHSECHPEMPTWAKYHDGKVTIICCECEQEIASFIVAEKPSVLKLVSKL